MDLTTPPGNFVDDFNLAGTPEFVKKIISVEEELNVSKVEEDVFWFTGLDVKAVSDRIEISMEDYSQSILISQM